jgi:hypothetical protein
VLQSSLLKGRIMIITRKGKRNKWGRELCNWRNVKRRRAENYEF